MLNPSPVRVLLVDDDDDLRAAMAQTLTLAGLPVQDVGGAEAALDAIAGDAAVVVISDVRMPRIDGIQLFRQLRAIDAELPVILITGHGDLDMAVGAMREGAWDFLSKPFDPDALVASARRAVEARGLRLDNRRLRTLAASDAGSPLIGRAPAIERLRETIALLADAPIDVLIEGETGTGKELVARMLHAARRGGGRFVPVACAALPDGLIEAELAGEAGGTGRVVQASGGTLFLDDVDRASPALQARLGQIVEDRAVRRSGGGEPEPLRLRVVASAGPSVDDLAADGRLSPELLYRLAAVRLRIPPLRERRQDVPLIFAHLLAAAAARARREPPPLTAAQRRHLDGHGWPGNVRELAHFADRVVLGLDEGAAAADGATVPSFAERVAAYEKGLIADALIAAGGDASAAMAALGLPRKTFYYKVQRLELDLVEIRRRVRSS